MVISAVRLVDNASVLVAQGREYEARRVAGELHGRVSSALERVDHVLCRQRFAVLACQTRIELEGQLLAVVGFRVGLREIGHDLAFLRNLEERSPNVLGDIGGIARTDIIRIERACVGAAADHKGVWTRGLRERNSRGKSHPRDSQCNSSFHHDVSRQPGVGQLAGTLRPLAQRGPCPNSPGAGAVRVWLDHRDPLVHCTTILQSTRQLVRIAMRHAAGLIDSVRARETGCRS